MFEQAFKTIDDILRKDAGASSELDYVEQTSWILFLKYLDDLEQDKATEAALAGKPYEPIIAQEYRWETWAAPKTKEGKLDHNAALSGEDLKDFVDLKLFPYLKKFKAEAESPDTIEYKIGEIFSEIKNKIQSGYTLREVLNIVDGMRFRSQAEKHELSHLYEGKIKNMGNAGRNGGEYYTPRPLIKTIVKVVDPQIGDKIYDGAVGSAGFLVEAFEYLKHSRTLSTDDVQTLQKKTFYGKEKKSLAYIIGIMNMILHGIEAPNILHTNTLAENLADIQEKDRFDVVLANPPFGGKERAEVQQNFPIKTGETAFLFLQHFIKILKAGGKAGIVIKNTFLSNTDNASVSLRKLLLESCNLHTVLDLPSGAFVGAGVKTVVLFFEKGAPTKKVWYYQLNLDRNLGKTNPLSEKDLAEFLELQKTKADSANSWSVDVARVDASLLDLSVKSPVKGDSQQMRYSLDVIEEMALLDKNMSTILTTFKNLAEKDLSKVPYRQVALGSLILRQEMFNPLKQPDLEFNYIDISSIDSEVFTVSLSSVKKYKGKEAPSRAKKSVSVGDILFSTVRPALKRIAIVPSELDGAVASTGFTVLKPDGNKVDPRYLQHIICSGIITEQVTPLARGASYPAVSDSDVFGALVPLPEVDEQKRIADSLESLFLETKLLESLYQKKRLLLDEMKKSIFHEMFSVSGKP